MHLFGEFADEAGEHIKTRLEKSMKTSIYENLHEFWKNFNSNSNSIKN